MTRRRLPLLALAVVVLVGVVALVAHGRPLSSGSGRNNGGLPPSFWDYTLTTVIIVGALFALVAIYSLAVGVPGGTFTPPPHSRAWRVISTMAVIMGIGLLLRYLHSHGFAGLGQLGGGGARHKPSTSPPPDVRFRWEELAAVVGVLLIGAVVFATTRRRGTPRPWMSAPETLAAALDESLDDLRSDPDLRRAIIAAYARMERALAAAGVPRRPAEAPLEYLERALGTLDTSQTSVRRLTDLFQWARFSHHEPDPSMRDEALEALEAVRDELRAPARAAA